MSARRRLIGGFYAFDNSARTTRIKADCSATTDAHGLASCELDPGVSGEVIAVATRKGVRLPNNLVDAAIRLADGMPVTISSTAQDLRRGRRTEIDFINGLIAAKGQEVGRPAPTHIKLVEVVKQVEHGTIPARAENLYGI